MPVAVLDQPLEAVTRQVRLRGRQEAVQPLPAEVSTADYQDLASGTKLFTVDDAIDTVIPTAWKKRLPRVFSR